MQAPASRPGQGSGQEDRTAERALDLYLNWDPSHLTWIGIDPVKTIAPYIDRIVHAQVDWTRVVDRLYEHGFTGTLSVEHEDPVWGGTDDKVIQGLRIAHRTLRPLVIG